MVHAQTSNGNEPEQATEQNSIIYPAKVPRASIYSPNGEFEHAQESHHAVHAQVSSRNELE